MFKRKISAYEAKQTLRDKSMRRKLLEFLQEETKESRDGGPDWPEPMRDDEDVEKELERILGN